MKQRAKNALEVTTNLVLLVVLGIILLRPSGIVGARVSAWVAERRVQRIIGGEWERIADAPRLSAGGGEVLLVEFADFQCPFCRQSHAALRRWVLEHPSVGVVFRHLPLTRIHPLAEGAATAAWCAGAQGGFLEAHDYLLSTDRWLEEEDPNLVATEVAGIDPSVFQSCIDGQHAADRIAADLALADRLGVRSTPSFVHPNGVFRGIITEAQLDSLLALARR